MGGVRTVLWAVIGALVIGLGTGTLGLVGVSVGSTTLSVGWSVAGRTLLSLIVLALLVLLLARRGPFERSAPVVAIGVAGLALDPLTWTAGARAGGPLFGVHVAGSPGPGLALDVLVWVVVVVGAGVLGLHSREDLPE